MSAPDGNKYRYAREVAGMTQERWAEAIGVDSRSVARYEAGATLPSDETVAMMQEVSGLSPLGYWHIKNKCLLAETELPTVQRVPLPQAVVGLICAMRDFSEDENELMRVVADGKVTEQEIKIWLAIREKLDEVVRAALQVKYAEVIEHDDKK